MGDLRVSGDTVRGAARSLENAGHGLETRHALDASASGSPAVSDAVTTFSLWLGTSLMAAAGQTAEAGAEARTAVDLIEQTDASLARLATP